MPYLIAILSSRGSTDVKAMGALQRLAPEHITERRCGCDGSIWWKKSQHSTRENKHAVHLLGFYDEEVPDHHGVRDSKPEIRQAWMIIRATSLWPVILPIAL